MCGRYDISTPAKELASFFDVIPPSEAFKNTSDARPTNDLPIVIAHDEKTNQMVIGHWGYPIKIAGKDKELINIRAESILEKPFFQRAAKTHRCIILADGFYEWKKIPGSKSQKYRFALNHGPMAFAGIYQWKTKKLSDEMRPFFSIITVPANKTMSPIHDRMPVILSKGKEKEWLSPDTKLDLLSSFKGKLEIAKSN